MSFPSPLVYTPQIIRWESILVFCHRGWRMRPCMEHCLRAIVLFNVSVPFSYFILLTYFFLSVDISIPLLAVVIYCSLFIAWISLFFSCSKRVNYRILGSYTRSFWLICALTIVIAVILIFWYWIPKLVCLSKSVYKNLIFDIFWVCVCVALWNCWSIKFKIQIV